MQLFGFFFFFLNIVLETFNVNCRKYFNVCLLIRQTMIRSSFPAVLGDQRWMLLISHEGSGRLAHLFYFVWVTLTCTGTEAAQQQTNKYSPGVT